MDATYMVTLPTYRPSHTDYEVWIQMFTNLAVHLLPDDTSRQGLEDPRPKIAKTVRANIGLRTRQDACSILLYVPEEEGSKNKRTADQRTLPTLTNAKHERATRSRPTADRTFPGRLRASGLS